MQWHTRRERLWSGRILVQDDSGKVQAVFEPGGDHGLMIWEGKRLRVEPDVEDRKIRHLKLGDKVLWTIEKGDVLRTFQIRNDDMIMVLEPKHLLSRKRKLTVKGKQLLEVRPSFVSGSRLEGHDLPRSLLQPALLALWDTQEDCREQGNQLAMFLGSMVIYALIYFFTQ